MLNHERIIGTVGFMGGIMSLPTPFCVSWGDMLLYSQEALCGPGEHIHPEHADTSLHDQARSQLVARMQGDWLLMLDADTEFQPDIAARMVTTMTRWNVDVLTGIYSFKKYPHFPVLYMRNQETDQHEVISDWDRSADIFPVDAAGGGCLLVRRSVFERIRRELKEHPFERIAGKGEDFSFFRRLQRLGIRPYCAWKIELTHLAYNPIRPSKDYEPENWRPQAHDFEVEGKRVVSGASAVNL